MKYIKAEDVFPESLLQEMQKYIQGKYIYIPKSPGNYEKWGAYTGGKNMTAQRNKEMVQAFRIGASISQLAELYNLAEDTVKKIVDGSR